MRAPHSRSIPGRDLCGRAWFLEPRTARRVRSDRRALWRDSKATGEYEDFLTGFVLPDGKVWGRPVGVVVAERWIVAGF